ncbi:Hypothetical protein SRAE_2000348500 [Strongyloides ratti]|uniref:Uncharacterized protein n=1 Tax=Strongyloides ratti TaxID=34506 RepID=A0A090LMT2_STRRB|nr:Hypothetical protein SRAE_2000348500 [Strongyloides ratti]CEF68830.1 Hypothetical protein SRAE_2000348500 [Strongyloides ratti]
MITKIFKIFLLTLFCFEALSNDRSIPNNNNEILALKKRIYLLLPIQNQNDVKSNEILEDEDNKPYFKRNKILLDPEIGIFWDLFGIPRRYMKRSSKKWTKLGPIWG